MSGLLRIKSGKSRPDFLIRYRKFGVPRSVIVRDKHLRSDLQSVLELAAGDCYGLAKFAWQPDVVIDGGGNTGLFSLAAAARWPAVRLLCFEPMPANVELIRRHLAMNNLTERVELFPIALGGDNRKAQFFLREANQGSLGGNLEFSTTIDVDVRRLWDFYEPIRSQRILVKLDVEGAEFEILNDFFRQAPLSHIAFVLEVHGDRAAQNQILAGAEAAGLIGCFWEQASETAHLFLTTKDLGLTGHVAAGD